MSWAELPKKVNYYYQNRSLKDFSLLCVKYAIRGARRMNDSYFDWKYGIQTSGYISTKDLKHPTSDFHWYQPSEYQDIFSALRRLKIVPQKDIFLDFGSGLGRTLVIAATFPFKRVVGVELSAPLVAQAKENLAKTRAKLLCPIEIVELDAAQYEVPEGVTVIFFYNPFSGELLNQVLKNIKNSLNRAPRKIKIVFKNPSHFEASLKKHDWLKLVEEFHFPFTHRVVIYESVTA